MQDPTPTSATEMGDGRAAPFVWAARPTSSPVLWGHRSERQAYRGSPAESICVDTQAGGAADFRRPLVLPQCSRSLIHRTGPAPVLSPEGGGLVLSGSGERTLVLDDSMRPPSSAVFKERS
jgi:hypothetical protein